MPELTTEFIDYCFEEYEKEKPEMEFYKYVYKLFHEQAGGTHSPIQYHGEFAS